MTTFGDMVYGFGGIPLFGPGGWIPVPGNVYWVDQLRGSDGQRGDKPDRAMATLSAVHSKMTANQNDIVFVIGSTTGTNPNIDDSYGSSIAVREADTLTWSKSQCHIVGLAHNHVSQRVSIRPASGVSAFTPLLDLTGSGCVLANFHIYDSNASTTAKALHVNTGERNAFYNLHIYGMAHATASEAAGARSLVITGAGSGEGENYFQSCVIGGDTVPRDNSAEIELAASTARNKFKDCDIITYAKSGAGDNDFVRTAANGMDRWNKFDNCDFINTGPTSGGATMTEAMDISATGNGVILLKTCSLYGATDWEANGTEGGKVVISGHNGLAADIVDMGLYKTVDAA